MRSLESVLYSAIAPMTEAFRRTVDWFRRWSMLPAARYHWAAAVDANKERGWPSVVRHIEAMQKYWKTDESCFLLGTAYAKLERFDQALGQFEDIRGALPHRRSEQEMRLNMVVSLWNLGRPQEALDLLPADRIDDAFPDYREAAWDMRRRLVAIVGR